MTPAEAARIMNTARKHNEAVTDLALELMMMLSECFKDKILELETDNDKQLTQILDLDEQINNLNHEIDILRAENADLSTKLAETCFESAENMTKSETKSEQVEKPRRGRPPKKTTEAEAIHELAKDIFSE